MTQYAAPAVSVLMAAYNSEATLPASVQSVLAQSYPHLELLVIDDAGERLASDALAHVRDPRLRTLRRERNRGTAAARNTGLAAARAPLVAQLDADDMWHEDYLARIVPCFDDPTIALAYSNAAMVRVGSTEKETYIKDASLHPMAGFPQLIRDCGIPAPAVTMRTDAVRAVGGYAEWLWSHEDHHLYLKLARAGWGFAYVDDVLASYVLRPDRMSAQTTRVAADHLVMVTALALRHPLTPGAVAEWRRVAASSLKWGGRELVKRLRRR